MQDAVDPVPADVGSLQKQLKAKERELAKLLKRVDSLQVPAFTPGLLQLVGRDLFVCPSRKAVQVTLTIPQA